MRNHVKKNQQASWQGYHKYTKDYRRIKMEHDKHFQELKEEHNEENFDGFLVQRSKD